MTEDNIIHENDDHYVRRDREAYVVFVPRGTHVVSDSAYDLTDDGMSIAIARCDYLANRRRA